jgi:hypothetical protein
VLVVLTTQCNHRLDIVAICVAITACISVSVFLLQLSHFAPLSVQHTGQFNQFDSMTRLPKDVLDTAESIVVTGLLRQRGADAREGLTLELCTAKQLKVCLY